MKEKSADGAAGKEELTRVVGNGPPAAVLRPPNGLWWWSSKGMTPQMRPLDQAWVRFADYDRLAKKLARLEALHADRL